MISTRKKKTKHQTEDGDFGWPKDLRVKYLSHWNQCQVPIDFSRAWMLSAVEYTDTEPQKFIQLAQMVFLAVLNQKCLHTCSSAKNPHGLFHLIFFPAAKPFKEVSALPHWLVVLMWPLARHIREGRCLAEAVQTRRLQGLSWGLCVPWGENDRKGRGILRQACCRESFSWTYTPHWCTSEELCQGLKTSLMLLCACSPWDVRVTRNITKLILRLD